MKDIYVYENTNVLINKLDIRDSKKLDEAEGEMVSFNTISLLSNPLQINSVFDVKKIHKLLFGELYEWAGENRKINIYKDEPVLGGLSVSYSDCNNIDKDLKKLESSFKNINWDHLSHKEKIDALVSLISKMWRIHCFREGNTRAVTVFLYLLMKQIKLKVNIDFIGKHSKYFRNALVLASIDQYSEYEHLTSILQDSISMKDIPSDKYKTIREYEVDKYEYRGHKYKD